MLKDDLKQPQRQALLGVAVLYFKNLRIGFNILLALVVPIFAGWGVGGNYLYFALGVVLVALGVIAYFQFRNFFFQVVDDKFIINQGVIKKEELSVPFSRIQSVHIKQNIIQQLLNVVALEIDTAGSTQKEVGIPALTRSYAEALKEFLLTKKEEERTIDESAPENTVIEQPKLSAQQRKGTRILHLNVVDLFRVGITENHLRTGLIAFGVLFGYFNQLEEVIKDEVEAATRQVEAFVTTMAYVIPIGIVLFALVSVLLSLIRTALRYFNLSVYLSNRGLTVEAGLLKRQENVVPANKIQYIVWKSNPLRKLIGYYSLAIYQASSGEVNRKNAVTVPGCKKEQMADVNHAFFPELDDKALATLKPTSFWQLRLLTFLGVLPALAIAVLGWFQGWWLYIAAGAYLTLADFFIKKYVASFSVHVSHDLLEVKRGWVFPHHVLLKHFKIQGVNTRQSIFQKRRGLVSLTLFTASGSINIPFIPEAAGYALADYLLYKVESSNLEWM
jgi:putative membrane protein